jgi:hypothetical protein
MPVKGGGEEQPAESELTTEMLENLKAFRNAAGSVTLKEGNLNVQAALSFDLEHKTALLNFFTARKVQPDLLQFVPRDSVAALLLALPEGTTFWDRLGKTAPLLETKLILLFGKEVIDRVTQLAVVPAAGGKKGEPPQPLLVFETVDADAAKFVLKALTRELKLEGNAQGRTVVLGGDKTLVAKALAEGAKKKGLLSESKVADVLKGLDAHVVGLFSGGEGLVQLLKEEAAYVRSLKETDFNLPPVKGDDGGGSPFQKLAKTADRYALDLSKIVEPLPPFVFSLTKEKDRLILTGRQAGLKTNLARTIDLLLEWDVFHNQIRQLRWMKRPPGKGFDKEIFPDKKQSALPLQNRDRSAWASTPALVQERNERQDAAQMRSWLTRRA